MEVRSVGFIAAACGGELLAGAPNASVRRICTDSRQAAAGDLFVALSGERFDGHQFLADTVRQGARALMVEKGRELTGLQDCAVIAVDNTRKALGALASRYRQDFELPVIAVTGSNGKTTTKELLAAVLSQKLSTLFSQASFNNDIGVPLTLLRLDSTHQAAVLEAGTNHPGELLPLLRMIQPRYGVLTNIGREHLEFFKDLEGVAREEGSVAQILPANGKLFLNGDNEWCLKVAEQSPATVVRVGAGGNNDWRYRVTRLDRSGTSFRLEGPSAEWSGEYRVGLLGRHQAMNASLAVALGAELGLNRSEIAAGLARCEAPKMRLQLFEVNGIRLLDDAYNANADSVIAALRTLQDLPCRGRRVAVLGDMAELGGHTESAHEEVGKAVAELGIGQLFAIGRMAASTARAARAAGLSRVLEFTDLDSAAAAVKSFVKPGDLVLVKASRSSRLERVSEALKRD